MHGTFKNGRPNRPSPAGGGEIRIILGLLLREVAVGYILYLLLGPNSEVNLVICTMVIAVLLALTNKHGLLRHRTRLDIATECFAILLGGLAFRRLLAMTPALLAWH